MNRDDEKRVREIVREEIELAFKLDRRTGREVARRNEPASPPGFSSTDRSVPRLAVDELCDALEAKAMEPVLNDYAKRREVGMSEALAEVKAKMAQGMDLTPLNFTMPAASYFGQYDHRAGFDGFIGGVQGFAQHFIKLVEDDETGDAMTIDKAYMATCAKFGVPPMRKAGRHDKALSELPASPRGGFRLGRGEAEQATKQGFLGRLLGRGDEGDEEGGEE